MTQPPAVTVRPATADDLGAVSRVLAAAFAADPVMATFVPGPGDRRRRVEGFFRAVLLAGAVRHGAVDVAVDPAGRVLGAAAWEAPGGAGHLLAQVRRFPSFLASLGWRGIRRALRNQSVLAGHRPRPAHWYLAAIGVDDGARGLGVGSRLLSSRLRELDVRGEAAYLEASTSRSRTLYESFGFRHLATVRGLGGGVAPSSMWRPATA
ncbi:GNAT family N-acetyltransferase [Kineococcus rhizosphaerae]|uniref:L-amino acid N-acyltransferase YncA n=1 Tax=Kineococcus rhizosphaerae TaxID=559628 RepID=A0A2T0R8K9_9ACTN|nr:GNAT family N-acetyltransferase [Kineococcus rhizosphaerae]PRY17506.1 L-amino acid N-acyltransferase YncA [Kineococcus rhizosphaerae]